MWILVVVLLFLVGIFELFSNSLRPLVETVAVSEATNLITATMSDVVQECMDAQDIQYSDLMQIDSNPEDDITTVTGQPLVISKLRNSIVQTLVSRVKGIDSGQLGVPLGNLTGWMLLSGLGPKLRVSIDSVGDVTAQLRNEFDSAGINQTHHQVMMDISVTVHLFIPGKITAVTVDQSVCLAETVLIGKVPNSYIQIGS